VSNPIDAAGLIHSTTRWIFAAGIATTDELCHPPLPPLPLQDSESLPERRRCPGYLHSTMEADDRSFTE
jgi:hypothetical protein